MEKAADNLRYERKFLIAGMFSQQVEMLIKLHPAGFSQAFPPRYVNNIYYDFCDMQSYFANIDGTAQRVKVRCRWYGDMLGQIEKPTLELKIKNALLGTKKTYPLASFILGDEEGLAPLPDILNSSAIPESISHYLIGLKPSLINRYYRSYYQSADHDFRITLDTEMQYYPVGALGNSFLHCSTDYHHIILELKYACHLDQCAATIVNHFPFRLSRNSKYINGIKRTANI